MAEILCIKVIKPAGSLGKLFHRISATQLGNVKDCPKPQVPCCELKTSQISQCRWITAGSSFRKHLFSYCRINNFFLIYFNMGNLLSRSKNCLEKAIFLPMCETEHSRPTVFCYVPL